jgi:hypothetical protein
MRQTRHFNGLSEAEQERLVILVEECGEVIQAASKILRHGYESTNPKAITPEDELPETNRSALERELGDLGHAVRRMEAEADLNPLAITARAASKPERIRPYLHHQPEPWKSGKPEA